ncbi:MAG: hypothetical protein ACYC3X_03930 [Pirellulaceae bacterium]
MNPVSPPARGSRKRAGSAEALREAEKRAGQDQAAGWGVGRATWDGRRGTGDVGRATWDGRRGTGDVGRAARGAWENGLTRGEPR